MELTEKLGLKKPDLTDYVNIGDLNDNMDILDGEIGSMDDDLESHKAEKATDTIRPHGMGRIASKDYEEGTWTPTLYNVDTGYIKQEGYYTRIGNRVIATFNLQFPTSIVYSMSIRSLPFSGSFSDLGSVKFNSLQGIQLDGRMLIGAVQGTSISIRQTDGLITNTLGSASLTGDVTLSGLAIYRA